MKIKILKNNFFTKGTVVIMMSADVHEKYIKGFDSSKINDVDDELGDKLNEIYSL